MDWQIIGPIGTLSMLLSLAALAAWLIYWARPKRWLANLGLVLALAACFTAQMHSSRYVSRIDVDPAARIAEMKARQQAKEQALIDSRSDEVAQIRFAEDGQGEFLDTAGMDETDLKYLQAITESDEPEWKKNKKQRGSSAAADDSLESMIGGGEVDAGGGADVTELEAEQPAEPILLEEASVMLANQIDSWNLKLTTMLLWIALAILVADYLRRANLYREASWPLPLPSAWLNACNRLPVVHQRPQDPRRSMPGELKWLTLRGDAFIYFTDQAEPAQQVADALAGLQRWPYRLDLLRVQADDASLSDAFVFEALWYGRSSFIVDAPERSHQLLDQCIERLKKRRETKACTAQSVHLVWDLATPLPENTLQQFRKYAEPAGFSLFINSSRPS